MLKDNLNNVEAVISQTCQKAGRDRADVRLIAVSKTKPIEMLQEIYDCGIRDFGENKVQELASKFEQLPKDIRWHLIGHLQTNKVKYIIDKVFLIHSVDSYKLAMEISKQAVKHQVNAGILIEVNVSEEESKFGVKCGEVTELLEQISVLPNIFVKGLMTVAPYVDDPEENRTVFSKLKQLSVDITRKNIDNVTMEYLSMGMSGDYPVAIEEGAVYVRVGTSIFGERDYNK
ncbi:MAG TPA: YggS family pyridoxal phosphate-dependent enzyme [Lachnospiraceae bacterium]|nr:YggS family pyridoxal phosphate-dependent enzyme [Lachnospiraceae bacterium]